MALSVQHTIKIKDYSGIKCTSQSQQRNLRILQKKEDRFNKVYDSDGEPVPFYDMEYIEDAQYFDDYALPDVSPPDDGNFSLMTKIMNLLRKEGTDQIIIYRIQCMLKLHHVKSKRRM